MKKENPSYKAIFQNGNEIFLNSSNSDVRIVDEKGDTYTIEYQNKIYKIKILAFNPETKEYTLDINDQSLSLQLKNGLDQLIEEMGMDQITQEVVSKIEAPMPGLVLEVCVKEGQSISEGEPIVILEAMKMENIIKSKANAVVEKVWVSKSDKVEKSQLLVSFQQ